MQREITQKTMLHDKKGHLVSPGYAKKMLFEYNRKNIKAGIFSLKEWDFYQITMGEYVVQMTIGHLSYIANFSAKLISVKNGEVITFSRLKPLPLRSMKMPENPEIPNIVEVNGKDYHMAFNTKEDAKTLEVKAQDKKIGNIDILLELKVNHENDKMVIATPFEKKNQFYMNYKENFYSVNGTARFGDVTVTADEKDTAILDWGRGVWPFKHEWFWGNGAVITDDGKFGFNIGWGFGDLSFASENMFFWNEKAYKLGTLAVERNADDYMAPWKFKDSTGCFEFVMTPVFDNQTSTKLGIIRTKCHQIFGKYNGTATLPDGKKIIIKDMPAFCEHTENRW
jgi:hypothetical protein